MVHSTTCAGYDLAVVERDAVGHHLDDVDVLHGSDAEPGQAGEQSRRAPLSPIIDPAPALLSRRRRVGVLLGDLGCRLDPGQAPTCHDDGRRAELIQWSPASAAASCALLRV